MPGMSNQPFLASSGNKYEAQKVKPGFVLAGMEGMTYNAGTFMMSPGDKFFQYTDGVPEAANNKNALYGMDRLEAVLNSNLDKKPNDLRRSLMILRCSVWNSGSIWCQGILLDSLKPVRDLNPVS